MNIDASGMDFKELNERIRTSDDANVVIENCCGQRFIASGMSGKDIAIRGIPGNALGAYLNGGKITVFGNAQDAVADTMNDGEIVVHGSAGDALGYAMRGGAIYVEGNSGYRTGIHMKEYGEKIPKLIIGGTAGSFLGEYLAGGVILVLNLQNEEKIVGNFTGTGMHGGKIYLRTETLPVLPKQVSASPATAEDMRAICGLVDEFAARLDGVIENVDAVKSSKFFVLRPNARNPYKRLYTIN